MPSFGAVYCIYDDHEYLTVSIDHISKYLKKVLFLISDTPWNGSPADNSDTITKVQDLCSKNPNFELIQGHWTNEIDQRNYGLTVMLKNQVDFTLIIDSDEIYDESIFINLLNFISTHTQYDAFHLEWNTYWKKSYHVIYPRENYKPVVAVRTNHFQFTIIRGGITAVFRSSDSVIKYQADYNAILIPPNVAICHHLSYARSDAFIKRKIETSSHNPEFKKDWYDNIWLKWAPDMIDLHPVTPEQYKIAIGSDFSSLPASLQCFIKQERLPNRLCSIIILNWNSCDLLKRCLTLIQEHTTRNYEIIIVDNGSKDDSVEFIKNLDNPRIRIVLNDKNEGFAGGVNRAIRLTKNSDICLLNVDAEVQPDWLDNLYASIMNIPTCGIVGPLGNSIENGYQKEGSIEKDMVVANVHGFCMLILRELLNKIGLFDERFFPGGCEDMDYCMRARLAKYTVAISAKSLVIHKAHQVYELNGIDTQTRLKLDRDHEQKYYEKYFGMLLDYGASFNYFAIDGLPRKTGLMI